MANTTGKKFGGRKKGTPNKDTLEFRQAVTKLLEHAAPKMIDWLEEIDDPQKRLDMINKLAEFAAPRISRVEQQMLDSDGEKTDPVKQMLQYVEERNINKNTILTTEKENNNVRPTNIH